MRKNLLLLSFLSVILLGFLDRMGNIFYFYWNSITFHIIVHIVGGLAVGLFVVWLSNATSRKKIFVLSLIFALIIGVIWEAFEYHFHISNIFASNYISETLYDLIADVCGGIVAGLIANSLI